MPTIHESQVREETVDVSGSGNRNSILFQPFRLHDITLPNRIVLSPMTRGRAGAARLANRLMAGYYVQRSSAGLLITEATTISEQANGWNESPGIYTDEMAEAWKPITAAVHPIKAPQALFRADSTKRMPPKPHTTDHRRIVIRCSVNRPATRVMSATSFGPNIGFR